MTQLIDKNKLLIDEIRFNNDNEIILYKDKIKIELGSGFGLEDKLMNLESILLSKLEGKKWNPGSVGLFGKQWKRNI